MVNIRKYAVFCCTCKILPLDNQVIGFSLLLLLCVFCHTRLPSSYVIPSFLRHRTTCRRRPPPLLFWSTKPVPPGHHFSGSPPIMAMSTYYLGQALPQRAFRAFPTNLTVTLLRRRTGLIRPNIAVKAPLRKFLKTCPHPLATAFSILGANTNVLRARTQRIISAAPSTT